MFVTTQIASLEEESARRAAALDAARRDLDDERRRADQLVGFTLCYIRNTLYNGVDT